MANLIIPTKALSRFMQLLDGSFPSGTFVHSFGLEPHVVLDKVTNISDLELYFDCLIEDQYLKLEFAFALRCFDLLAQGKLKELITEENKFSAMLSFEFAQASETIGHNYLKHIHHNVMNSVVKEFFDAIIQHQSIGNEIAVLSAYAVEMKLDCPSFLLLWSKKNLINIAGAVLKISRIKPSDVQKLLFKYDDKLCQHISNYLDNEEVNSIMNFNPLFEQVIYQHLDLEPKLFMT